MNSAPGYVCQVHHVSSYKQCGGIIIFQLTSLALYELMILPEIDINKRETTLDEMEAADRCAMRQKVTQQAERQGV